MTGECYSIVTNDSEFDAIRTGRRSPSSLLLDLHQLREGGEARVNSQGAARLVETGEDSFSEWV